MAAPCQFNALPTHGNCKAIVGMEIQKGHHGDTRVGLLRVSGILAWPGPIHEGRGGAVVVINERATDTQREALLSILGGEDTEP